MISLQLIHVVLIDDEVSKQSIRRSSHILTVLFS